MTSKSTIKFTFLPVILLGLLACTPKEPVVPSHNLEQLKLQSQMKALAAEVVKLRESRIEVAQLKASIALMDSQITVYQTKLEEKAEEPKIEVVAAPRDPDIINLRGNIYVLIREIDSLKKGMSTLEILNDSLEIQIEQLAVQTHTKVELDPKSPPVKSLESPVNPVLVMDIPEAQEIPDITEAQAVPAKQPVSQSQGYTLNADYRMAYNDALNKYFNNEYLESIQEFRVVIEREPDGAYADNAQYWIGECYYSLEDYESAITEFEKVFTFQENNKADHALFKIAISYQQLGRYLKARENMNKFVTEYPESELIAQAHAFLSGTNQE